ncbi:Uncharacterized membrane protein YGL010W [Gulbenkiania indica]|uniref:Uncharacterized membrane protein YGL010W n=1 Tax=Gulbenkiania indica TaxID=375574 RepID=A0A0K6GW59_9NEIS|nr:Mpo1-like protein [Gulbenkiania indica]CUA82743.1 Uncharacterized membrane protein YGL010W [Gulbenkiania indica]
MKTLNEHLIQYAAYHRDRRNILTHFFGIPLIVIAVAALLGRPQWALGPLVLTPAHAAVLATLVYYFRLDRGFGWAMLAFMGLALWAGVAVAAMPTPLWLVVAVGLFLMGWMLQFLGHLFEGRKPAFVDDLIGLLIGPLFIVAEWAFMLGWRREVATQIEAAAGPVRQGRRLKLPA